MDFNKFKFAKQSNNILIGNSASIENNHVDAFHQVSKLNIEGRKIIYPLNYGESKVGYTDIVLKKGNTIFSNFLNLF